MAMTIGTYVCPECGTAVPLPVELVTVSAAGAAVTVNRADVFAHAWTHEDP